MLWAKCRMFVKAPWRLLRRQEHRGCVMWSIKVLHWKISWMVQKWRSAADGITVQPPRDVGCQRVQGVEQRAAKPGRKNLSHLRLGNHTAASFVWVCNPLKDTTLWLVCPVFSPGKRYFSVQFLLRFPYHKSNVFSCQIKKPWIMAEAAFSGGTIRAVSGGFLWKNIHWRYKYAECFPLSVNLLCGAVDLPTMDSVEKVINTFEDIQGASSGRETSVPPWKIKRNLVW